MSCSRVPNKVDCGHWDSNTLTTGTTVLALFWFNTSSQTHSAHRPSETLAPVHTGEEVHVEFLRTARMACSAKVKDSLCVLCTGRIVC